MSDKERIPKGPRLLRMRQRRHLTRLVFLPTSRAGNDGGGDRAGARTGQRLMTVIHDPLRGDGSLAQSGWEGSGCGNLQISRPSVSLPPRPTDRPLLVAPVPAHGRPEVACELPSCAGHASGRARLGQGVRGWELCPAGPRVVGHRFLSTTPARPRARSQPRCPRLSTQGHGCLDLPDAFNGRT